MALDPTSAPDPDALLRELAQEGQAPAPRADEVSAATLAMRRRVIGQAESGMVGLKHLRYTHEDCIDKILMQPGISQGELARIYEVSEAWISIVINCDAFKAKLAERREELIDPALTASLNERFGALAQASVDRLLARITDSQAQVPDKTLLEAAALGAKAIGLGEPKTPTGAAAADHLAAIAHRLLDLNRPAAPAIDVQARQIS